MPRTLRALIDAEAPLRPARAIQLAVQMLDALAVLHRARVAHGGVRAENVELHGATIRLAPALATSATAWADVHATAEILYELLTRVRAGEAPASMRTPSILPARLDHAMARALDASHEARFEDAAAFAHELRVCLVDALGAALRPTPRF